jgi:hypothetical protein
MLTDVDDMSPFRMAPSESECLYVESRSTGLQCSHKRLEQVMVSPYLISSAMCREIPFI